MNISLFSHGGNVSDRYEHAYGFAFDNAAPRGKCARSPVVQAGFGRSQGYYAHLSRAECLPPRCSV